MKCFAARFSFVLCLLPSFSFPPSLYRFEPQCLFCFDSTAHTKTCAVFSRFSKNIKTLMLTSERGFREISVCWAESQKNIFLPWSQRTGRLEYIMFLFLYYDFNQDITLLPHLPQLEPPYCICLHVRSMCVSIEVSTSGTLTVFPSALLCVLLHFPPVSLRCQST